MVPILSKGSLSVCTHLMTRVYQNRSDPDSILLGFRGCYSLRAYSLNYQDSIDFLFPLAARCVLEMEIPAIRAG